mgnify:CR=1 FL=1
MSGYDRWLEAPFQRREAEHEAFLAWCEENELDSNAPASYDAFQEACHDENVERMADEYEAYLERIQDERDERDE